MHFTYRVISFCSFGAFCRYLKLEFLQNYRTNLHNYNLLIILEIFANFWYQIWARERTKTITNLSEKLFNSPWGYLWAYLARSGTIVLVLLLASIDHQKNYRSRNFITSLTTKLKGTSPCCMKQLLVMLVLSLIFIQLNL